jgi:hypothetical protein
MVFDDLSLLGHHSNSRNSSNMLKRGSHLSAAFVCLVVAAVNLAGIQRGLAFPLESAFLSRTPNLLGGKGIHSRFENPTRSRRSVNPWPHPNALLYLSRSYSQESKGGQISAKGSQAAAKVRNQQIVTLGRDRDWKGILALYHEQCKDYNNVNLSTTMSQLGRIRSVDKRDPSFVKFVDDLANIIEARGLEWMGIRSVANIAHVVGKIQLKSNSAQQIIEFAARKENAAGTG